MPGTGIYFGLMLCHPQDLGSGETGQRHIASDLDELLPAHALVDRIALGLGTLIIPQDGRPEHLASLIQQNQPVHLAGQADRGNIFHLNSRNGQHLADALRGRPPPLVWVLFRPQRPWG